MCIAIWPAQGWGFRPGLFIVARTREPLSTLAPVLTAAVTEIDASTPVVDLSRLAQTVSSQLRDLRLAVLLLAAIALIAATLAAAGIYGVITQTSPTAHERSRFAWSSAPALDRSSRWSASA